MLKMQLRKQSGTILVEARLYVAAGNVLFGASASDRFVLNDSGFCQTRRQWKALNSSSLSSKRSFKNRRRRYGVIRQNNDIRNMHCHSGNARFYQNPFKHSPKER